MNSFEKTESMADSHARILKMHEMYEAVFGEKLKEEPYDEEAGPTTQVGGYPPELLAFENALQQRIEPVGTEQERMDFNLRLDKKLKEYRERIGKYNSDIKSEGYKDSFYKLIIANTFRTYGSVGLEESYKIIEGTVGIGAIDGALFNRAWRVIKGYVEGRAGEMKGGTGFPEKK